MESHRFTRRDILAGLLGIPFAACAGARDATRDFDGEIVGASDDFGHRLRDKPNIAVPEDRWERVGVVIVGGGVAGLTAAWRFTKSGFHDFILIELEPAPGGTSRSGTSPIVAYPWGAHYIPAPMKENRALVELLEEMGVLEGEDETGQPLVAEQFLCRDPEERVFFKGHWYEGLYLHAGETPEDRAQLDAFNVEVSRWVDWRDSRGRRAFTIPVERCSDDPDITSLDKLTMAEWLDMRGLTSSRLRWLVDYACRDDYGMTAGDTSAWAGLFYFASRVPKGGDESRPLITWPEGNGRLISHLHGAVASRVRLGLAAAEIVPTDPNGKKGVDVVAIDRRGAAAAGFHADQVVFAAPHFMSRYVIRPYRDDPPSHVFEFDYGAWMVANVFLRDRPRGRGFPPAWDNVIYESPSLGYVVATHQRGLDHGPTVFTYYYPMIDSDAKAGRTKLLGTDWQGWADVTVSDLNRAHPGIASLIERVDVMRWGHAMIRPRSGFVWGDDRAAAIRPYRGVHFAHSDLSGIPIFEEAFYHGTRVAEEVLAARTG